MLELTQIRDILMRVSSDYLISGKVSILGITIIFSAFLVFFFLRFWFSKTNSTKPDPPPSTPKFTLIRFPFFIRIKIEGSIPKDLLEIIIKKFGDKNQIAQEQLIYYVNQQNQNSAFFVSLYTSGRDLANTFWLVTALHAGKPSTIVVRSDKFSELVSGNVMYFFPYGGSLRPTGQHRKKSASSVATKVVDIVQLDGAQKNIAAAQIDISNFQELQGKRQELGDQFAIARPLYREWFEAFGLYRRRNGTANNVKRMNNVKRWGHEENVINRITSGVKRRRTANNVKRMNNLKRWGHEENVINRITRGMKRRRIAMSVFCWDALPV